MPFDRLLFAPFTPPNIRERPELEQRVRMFLLSHLLGPLIGLALTGYLFILRRNLDLPLLVIFWAVIGFWVYPLALRKTGRFALLAFLSLQHLTFLILFVSYFYGGISSPFFFWLLVVPLFGFFYLGDALNLRLAIVGALVFNVFLFLAFYYFIGPARERFPLGTGDTLSLLSVLGATIYVMTMALSHARLLTKQIALQQQSDGQRLIAEQLLFAKEAAETASRAKSEFLATTSHELRTPLNAIIGFSALMKKQLFGPLGDRYVAYLNDIEESGRHLLEIINDILDVAKAESGRLELSEENVNIRQVIAASLRLVHRRAAKAKLSITVKVPDQLPDLRADSRRVKQMLLNLIGNAIKFTPAGGAITISAVAEENCGVAISVADTGVGVDKEYLDKVTLPFFQVDNSLARCNEGVGLGLTLVVSIMARHGGALRLVSNLGQRTTATLDFPSSSVVSEPALFRAP
jgi:signal transduction histidine kinase